MSRATAEVPMRTHDVAADQLAVEAVGLVKSYGTLRVLAGVDLGVARGACSPCWGPTGPARRPGSWPP
jgi:ABC-type transporter Mla maintaining outer membrane lipid asymmetry ATPase subunit MlaF